MSVSYDPAKDRTNIRKHCISLDRVADFDFETALIDVDDRFEYGEERMIALGFIEDALFVAVFVETEAGVRAISLRRAQTRERKRYVEAP